MHICIQLTGELYHILSDHTDYVRTVTTLQAPCYRYSGALYGNEDNEVTVNSANVIVTKDVGGNFFCGRFLGIKIISDSVNNQQTISDSTDNQPTISDSADDQQIISESVDGQCGAHNQCSFCKEKCESILLNNFRGING